MRGEEIRNAISGPIVSISDASFDDANNLPFVRSSLSVFDFDKVKEEYIRMWGLSDIPHSVDALHLDTSGKVVFIEFKNCQVSEKGYEIRRKIFDSMILFEDMVPNGLSFSRENSEFILVYNEQKNRKPVEQCPPERRINESEAQIKLSKSLLGLGKEELIRFGLEYFQGYCFQKVHTYTKDEFEDLFLKDAETILVSEGANDVQ